MSGAGTDCLLVPACTSPDYALVPAPPDYALVPAPYRSLNEFDRKLRECPDTFIKEFSIRLRCHWHETIDPYTLGFPTTLVQVALPSYLST
jgi:hypothetical protein